MPRSGRPFVRLAPVAATFLTLVAIAHAPRNAGAASTADGPLDPAARWGATIARAPLPAPPRDARGAHVPPALRRLLVAPPDAPPPTDAFAVEDAAAIAPAARPGGMRLDATTVGANVKVNDTTGDAANTTNSETTIAAHDQQRVAAWNDGLTAAVSPGPLGFATSTDGGATFHDGGGPPVAPAVARWVGHPTLVADDAGHFSLVALYSTDGGANSSVAAVAGGFSGSAFAWNPPVVVASAASGYFDAPWQAVDAVTGNLYVSWTHVLPGGTSRIELATSTDHGAHWSAVQLLTDATFESATQSRLAVGPDHELQVIYFAYDDVNAIDVVRTRRSTDHAASFGAEVTLPAGPSGIALNQGAGPPGYNRSHGVAHPALAIDGTCGPNRGRLVATWDETFDYFADALGGLGAAGEANNTSNNFATTADSIVIGQEIDGTLSSGTDADWFQFTGTAGQNVVLYLAPTPGSSEDGFLYLFSGGTLAVNRAVYSHLATGTALAVYTLPHTGTYYIEVSHYSPGNGGYVLLTGTHAPAFGDEVARDVRDVVVQSSADGVSWTDRSIANDDAARFDDAFPEVAIDAGGQVWVDWYDHRNDAANGILTDVYAARSTDGGVSFQPALKLNDGASNNWNSVNSNLVPNMGDHGTLLADGCSVVANFADGRKGTPDSWCTAIDDHVPGIASAALAVGSPTPACGDSVALTANVCPASAAGTVQFFDGANPLGAAQPLDGTTGRAMLVTVALSGGAHTITAQYSGGGCWGGATSAGSSVTVNGVTTAVSLGTDGSPSTCGHAVLLTATVTPAGATGTVTFREGATSLGSAPVDGSGHAALSVGSLAAGSHDVTASYGGDACHAASASVAVTQVVGSTPSAVTLDSDAHPSACGAKVTFTATVTPAGATGTVTFTEGVTTLGAAPVDGSGHATLSVASLGVGSHDVTASFGGDACLAASASTPLTQVVDAAPVTVTLVSDVNPAGCGAKVGFTATVSPAGATGTITFKEGATMLGSSLVDGGGQATLSLVTLPVGAHDVVASYGGDACLAAGASAPLTQTVLHATTSVGLESDVNPAACGAKVNLTATVTPAGAGGVVTFTRDGMDVGSAPVDGAGHATLSVTFAGVGVHSIAAGYSGDACDTASVSPAIDLTVAAAPTSVALGSDVNPSTCGANVTLTATVTPAPTAGTVAFADGATALGSAPVDGTGHATLSLATLGAGTHALTATLTPDSCFAPSVAPEFDQVVDSTATSVALTADHDPTACGATVNLTATVTPAGVTGDIAFLDGGTPLGLVTPDAGGVAHLAVATLAAGAHTLVAHFTGDACHATSDAPALGHTVAAVATTTLLAGSPSPPVCGATDTLTATVHPAGATGTVTFKEGGAVLGAASLDSTGAARLVIVPALGAHGVTAVYAGDGCHAGSTSPGLFLVVQRGATALTLASDANPSVHGQAVTLHATVTPHVPGTVTFTDDAIVLGAALADSVTGEATYTTTTLTIGHHTLAAAYGGDGCHNPSASDTLAQVVNPIATAVAWTSSPDPVRFGGKVALAVQVSPAGASGTVAFLADTTVLGLAPVDAAGNASLSLESLATGKHDLTASYAGDSVHAASVSPFFSQVVLPNAAPAVHVLYPNGGETLHPDSTIALAWTASDDDSVTSVTLYVSRDYGANYVSIATGLPNTGSYDWVVTDPGTNTDSTAVFSAVFKVVARDGIGQATADSSDTPFSIFDPLVPVVVTQLDAQPFDGGIRVVFGFSNRADFASVTLERADGVVGPWQAVAATEERNGPVSTLTDRTVESGRSYWYRLVATTPSGARRVFGPVSGTAMAPAAFAMGPVWPNPARAGVQTEFAVPRRAPVRIGLWDVQGREVTVLVDGVYAPGRYHVAWDGVPDRGTLRSGLYFLRFDAPGARFVRRLVIAR